MAAPFEFEHSLAFAPDNASEILRAIPALPGVFALHGPPAPGGQPPAQPYLTRAADLRRRITRILAPPDLPNGIQSKRLNLRSRVARIDYVVTGSEFESTLTLYHATAALFSLDEARRRLKLRTPFFLRFTAENAYPRVYSTNRLSKRALADFYGPFPSRAAADRYCDAVLDLFKLRRCVEDLAPYPEHPGCVYQEMKKCLAPCNQACTPAGSAAYAHEADQVKRFFDTRGESMIVEIGLAREEASSALHFERAAELHAQWHRVKAAQSLADELVQPIPSLRAVILQKAAQPTGEPCPLLSSRSAAEGSASPETAAEAEPAAAVFLLQSGCVSGPARLSTLGVRAVKEQTSVGSSLFAQPLMLQAIPLEGPSPSPKDLSFLSGAEESASPAPSPQPDEAMAPATSPVILSEDATAFASQSHSQPSQNAVTLSVARSAESKDPQESHPATTVPPISATDSATTTPTLNPEARAAAVIASLEAQATAPADPGTLSDHLSLLRRWYYRPEKQRAGEVFLPNVNHQWPIRRILNGAARMALGEPTPLGETHRELVQRNPADEPQKPNRTKTLHAGRPDVERTVPSIDKPATFKSRRRSPPT